MTLPYFVEEMQKNCLDFHLFPVAFPLPIGPLLSSEAPID